MNNIMDYSNYDCTGCSICANSCNIQRAITMKFNKYGHYQPEVDNNKCIGCKKCKISCYKFMKSDKDRSIYDYKGFASYSLDQNVRIKASSGGVAYEIAKYGIENGYNIYGVKYNIELNRAEHVKLKNIDEIDIITGSKYIPSWNVDVFKDIDKNEKAIIFAAPCQCYGLRKMFKSNNIILVDFFCHGVPSQKLWSMHINNIVNTKRIGKIRKVSFRDKTEGWHEFSLKIEGENGEYRRNLRKDKFMRLFLADYCLGEACYNCQLRFNQIYSDIRLGDFWGPLYKNDKKGTSIVLTNSIGEDLIRKLNNLKIDEVEFEEVKKSQYKEEIKKTVTREKFMSDLKNDKSISYLYNKYELKKDIKQNIKKAIKRIIYFR